MLWPRRLTLAALAYAVALCGLAIVSTGQARAAEDDAGQILQSMSDYMAAQKTISLAFDSSLEVITPQMEKIQFASSGTLLMHRPNELKATRTGGYADVELFFDGKTLTVYGKNLNGYTELDAPGTIDQLIDTLRGRGWALPGADLLLGDISGTLMSDVISSKNIGLGVVGGVECHHLAFRNQDVDWQLWVEVGDKPIPRKLVITSKAIGGAPQYTLVVNEFKTDVTADQAMFKFTPPEGATKLDVDALAKLDELPPAASANGQ
jgi:hypothetical protein